MQPIEFLSQTNPRPDRNAVYFAVFFSFLFHYYYLQQTVLHNVYSKLIRLNAQIICVAAVAAAVATAKRIHEKNNDEIESNQN